LSIVGLEYRAVARRRQRAHCTSAATVWSIAPTQNSTDPAPLGATCEGVPKVNGPSAFAQPANNEHYARIS
jgi:hypothetical protein